MAAHEPTSAVEPAGAAPRAGPAPSRGLRFALLAHPSVQVVRFLTKLALPWFFTTEEFGEASLASLIVFGVQHVAVFGLDEALVSARGVSGGLWRAMRRLQDRLGVGLALAVAAAGLVLQAFPAQALLGRLLAGLAPILWVANRATLPTWLLVRERRFRAVFLVDLGAILAFSAATIAAAELGLGPWSLVVGWHANALVSLAIAARAARPHVPRGADGAQDWPALRANGAHLTGASTLAYVGERLDGAVVGFGLGRAPLGLFEAAQNVGGVLVGYAQSLADRLLLPTFAAHGRAQGLGATYLEALRTAILVVLPAHVVLALCAQPLVAFALPERWHAAGPLCSLLALAAAARCFDLVALTALKAAGRGRTVLRLGLVRLVFLVVALALSLPHGLAWVAGAVLASRALTAGVALALASTRLDLAPHRAGARLGRAGGALCAWALLAVPLGLWLSHAEAALHPAVQTLSVALAGVALWLLGRLALDRERLRAEVAALRARVAQGGAA